VPAVVDRCDERCGDHGPDARQLREPLAGFIRPAKAEELPIELVEPEIESAKLIEQIDEETPRQIGKVSGRDGLLRLLKESMDVSRARRSVGVGGWNARIYPACSGTIARPWP
jgi:hypothetical protein